MAQGVMVITEHWDNSFRKISLEAVCEGKRLAAEMGESLTAVVLGAGVADLAGLRLRGLMAVPPAAEDPAEQRAWFRRLAELQTALISSGMSVSPRD